MQSVLVKENATFGDALEALKKGSAASRDGWNGKGMFLILNQDPDDAQQLMHRDGKLLPHIMMKTVQGDYVPWLASQTDMLAEDWTISAVTF